MASGKWPRSPVSNMYKEDPSSVPEPRPSTCTDFELFPQEALEVLGVGRSYNGGDPLNEKIQRTGDPASARDWRVNGRSLKRTHALCWRQSAMTPAEGSRSPLSPPVNGTPKLAAASPVSDQRCVGLASDLRQPQRGSAQASTAWRAISYTGREFDSSVCH